MKDKDAQDAIKELKCLSTKSKKVDMDRVNNLFDKLLSDDNKNEGSKVVAYIKRASNLYEQHGLFDKAIADYKAAIKIYNGSKNKRSLYYNFCYANLRLGSIYGKLENYNVSASFLGEAIKHPSYSDKANYEWGRNYLRK